MSESRPSSLSAAEAELRRSRHQVRNELQLLTSLIALHIRQVQEPLAKRELVRCYRRVGVVGVIHQLTADADGMVRADLCLRTIADFIGAAAKTLDREAVCELALSLEADTIHWRHDQAARIALIIDELVGNAIQHAHAEPDVTQMELELAAVDGRARVSIRDHGRGLPDGFDPTTGDSLGLPMAVAVAQQLGGELNLRSPASGAGTLAELWLPLCARETP